MIEKQIKKVKTVSATSPTVEVPTNQQQQEVEKELITLEGITTSRIEERVLKANNPYPTRVFLRLDCVNCHNVMETCKALAPKHKKNITQSQTNS